MIVSFPSRLIETRDSVEPIQLVEYIGTNPFFNATYAARRSASHDPAAASEEAAIGSRLSDPVGIGRVT